MYYTGDGAHRHPEGYYQITGRMDDVLNVSGHRLGTAEVENVLVSNQCWHYCNIPTPLHAGSIWFDLIYLCFVCLFALNVSFLKKKITFMYMSLLLIQYLSRADLKSFSLHTLIDTDKHDNLVFTHMYAYDHDAADQCSTLHDQTIGWPLLSNRRPWAYVQDGYSTLMLLVHSKVHNHCWCILRSMIIACAF